MNGKGTLLRKKIVLFKKSLIIGERGLVVSQSYNMYLSIPSMEVILINKNINIRSFKLGWIHVQSEEEIRLTAYQVVKRTHSLNI